jgi:hypothetical protein
LILAASCYHFNHPCHPNSHLQPSYVQPLIARPAQTSQRRVASVTVAVARNGTEGGAALDPEAVTMLNAARKRIGTRPSSSTAGAAARPSIELAPDADFVAKVKAAWRIFFPEKQRPLTPKEEGKKRLRMILVADRYAKLKNVREKTSTDFHTMQLVLFIK